MKRTLIIVSILVVILGASAYLISTSRTAEVPVSSQTSQTSESVTSNSSSLDIESGEYVAFSPEAFNQATGTRILYFHAPWCPQCRDLDADITKNVVPAGVTIFKVDYDSNQELRRQYGVTLQTTLVKVDDTGKEIAKFIAYEDPSLQAVKANLL